MDTGTVTTGCFRVGHTAYLRYTARSVVPRLLVFLLLPILACFIASLWDMRWAFVGIIILFLIAPMVMAYIYFSKLLTPEAQKALSPKQVKLPAATQVPDSERYLTVTYLSANEENTPPPPVTFGWDKVRQITETRRFLILEVDGLGYPLIIPLEALPLQIRHT